MLGPDPAEVSRAGKAEVEYKAKLQKKGKIVGGPFLDTLGVGYILEVDSLEEMGDIFFESPLNFATEREVHPLGSFKDTLEGMKALSKK